MRIKQHKNSIVACLIFFILPFFAFWRNFDFTGINTTFFGAEFIGGYYPEFSLGMSIFGKFKDMLWDPYNILGIPHMGAVDRLGIFYPLKFILYFFGAFFSLNSRIFLIEYFSIFHITLAGIFMYIFSRKTLKLSFYTSLIVGLVFAFNGTSTRLIAYPNHMIGIAYLPLILYFLHKAITKQDFKSSLFAGLFIAPVLLSGYTPFYIYNNLFVLLFLLLVFSRTKKEIIRVISHITIANIFAILLSSVALISSIGDASGSERQAYNLGGSSANPYNPLMFIHYIFPGFFSASDGTIGIILGYVGITALILIFLAFWGSKNRYLIAVTVLAFSFFLLSLGNTTYLHQFMYLTVPKYSYFRYPGSMHYIVAFCLASIAGFGLKVIEKKRNIFTVAKLPILMASVMSFSFLIFPYFLKVAFYENSKIDSIVTSVLVTNVFFFLSLCVLYSVNRFPKTPIYKILLFIVICLQLFTVVSMQPTANSELDPRVFNGSNEMTDWLYLQTQKDYAKVYLKDSTIRYNSANLGLYQINGYFSITSKATALLFSPFYDDTLGSYAPDSRALDVAGVRYIVSETAIDTSKYSNLEKVKTFPVDDKTYGQFMSGSGNIYPIGTMISVYENTNYFPKLTFFTKAIFANSDEQASDYFQTIDDEKDTVVVTLEKPNEDVIALNNLKAGSKAIMNLEKYTNTEVIVHTNTDTPGILMLNDGYNSSWKVKIDGESVELLKTDVALRGVYLTKGEHVVKFYFQPVKLYIGVFISLLSLGFFLFIILRKNSAKGRKSIG
ncbi:MAG: hypothetical protein A2770_03010 [Candidatus Levybacteria bacterium RIFCSPHIGHO2_01_FULL_38_12]|nr:MAG: hypothetical protein A2770_03010 [Candidatus Levybacteria bacterium RIFCSPHIGHO2_01_FULL_38_12]